MAPQKRSGYVYSRRMTGDELDQLRWLYFQAVPDAGLRRIFVEYPDSLSYPVASIRRDELRLLRSYNVEKANDFFPDEES